MMRGCTQEVSFDTILTVAHALLWRHTGLSKALVVMAREGAGERLFGLTGSPMIRKSHGDYVYKRRWHAFHEADVHTLIWRSKNGRTLVAEKIVPGLWTLRYVPLADDTAMESTYAKIWLQPEDARAIVQVRRDQAKQEAERAPYADIEAEWLKRSA